MPSTATRMIDWDKIWDDQMKLTSLKGDGVEFWNKMASRINNAHSPQDNYTQEMMRRMALSPEMSVLDVGCGTGALTMPLAERVRTVTALDLSPVMLQYLQGKMAESKLTNINTISIDFVTQNLKDPGLFDVVLASRSLPMGNLRKALVKMNSLAIKYCYLTWIASPRETDVMLCKILGKEYHPYPDYIIIANMLFNMGIHANIEIFTVTGEQSYRDLDEAVNSSLRGQEADNQKREQLKNYFKESSVLKDGFWHRMQHDQWALIWWQKQ